MPTGAQAMTRTAWIAHCTRRLRQLRPDESPSTLATVVEEMWLDVSSFDPTLAAEIEHECWD